MKTQYIGLTLLFFIAALFNVQAQKSPASSLKTQTIKVYGECGMCKRVIEKSALQAGAASANWNEDTKVLNVSYSVNKTNTNKIQQSIAAAGYDTQDFTATNEAYNNLKECCHYQRKDVAQQKTSCCDNDKCMKDGKCIKDAAACAEACKDMNCCKKEGMASCCKDGKCDSKMECCKDMTACKDKGCCRS